VHQSQAAEGCHFGDGVAGSHPGGAHQESAEPGAVLREGCVALTDSDASERIDDGGPGNDDQRDGRRDHAKICEADPQHQLIGPIRSNIEHTPEETSLRGLPSHDSVHRIQHQPDEEQHHAGQLDCG
jgi:hypothetical protein